jgi:pantoate--beta-alanine ligase
MLIFRHRVDLRQYLQKTALAGRITGFVPTMGALHDGHVSLITAAKQDGCLAIASIFVNPTQFNNAGDLDKYPRTIGADVARLEEAGCDILYLPEIEDVYDGSESKEHLDFQGLDQVLEGNSRPGHFAGVAQVVRILLDIVQPDSLYMGQKDYQQVQIVQSMIKTLNLPVQLLMCPIIREENGLAMSSRNTRLSADGRERAAAIYKTLQKSAREATKRELSVIEQECIEHLNSLKGFKVDYFSFRHATNLQPIRHFSAQTPLVLVTAVEVENVRLLDNILLPHSE